ncbi:hypothetical protein [Acetobacterium bakii]|nr:hypothetical protein [Acetobacterium bakii]
MKDFNLEEYKNTKINKKIRAFIEYLYEKFGVSDDDGEFDNEYFSLLSVDDLIESLNYYIENYPVNAQITGDNYISFVTRFFKMLMDDYEIKNEIFMDIGLKNQFFIKAKKIISSLKETENKSCATDEQYEKLNEGINDFLRNNFSVDTIYDGIQNYNDGFKAGAIKKPKNYYRFVSIIPIKLIMKFALGNSIVISLKLEDLDIENGVLTIDSAIRLPLDEELIGLLKMYLEIRKYVLSFCTAQESKLFIKYNGEPYSNKEYDVFFKIMKDCIGTQSADLFVIRRISELLDKGLDMFTIARLSDKSNEMCMKLLEDNNSNTMVNAKIEKIFNDRTINEKFRVKKKGYLECPYCGNNVEAISEEWVLVQFKKDGKKHLACKKCRGENEEFSIQNI